MGIIIVCLCLTNAPAGLDHFIIESCFRPLVLTAYHRRFGTPSLPWGRNAEALGLCRVPESSAQMSDEEWPARMCALRGERHIMCPRSPRRRLL
ncbi:hypothetical protein HYQ46_009671 [Verticillium longisporum]|nr:hypothetical protein HYQ46_009671 [Verticillium longisporum]